MFIIHCFPEFHIKTLIYQLAVWQVDDLGFRPHEYSETEAGQSHVRGALDFPDPVLRRHSGDHLPALHPDGAFRGIYPFLSLVFP